MTKLKAPKKITLQTGTTPKPGKLSLSIQNTGASTVVISNATELASVLGLKIESLGDCPAPTLTLVAPVTFPVTLPPNDKLTVSYTVAIECANDNATGIGHEDYRTTVSLNMAALDGLPDVNRTNDTCPRAASGTDKGCNKGLEVLTDVSQK